MARIAGRDLPQVPLGQFAVPCDIEVGSTLSRQILAAAGVDSGIRVRNLTEGQVGQLRDVIDKNYKVEGDLRREVHSNIKRLMEIGCSKGIRHKMNLPVHGQRTRTNARTRRGPKKTVAGRGQKRGVAKK